MADLKSLDVLIVDHESASQFLLQELLKHEGFAVQIASTGTEALEIVEQSPRIDLVILESDLPDQPGVELIRKLKSSGFRGLSILMAGRVTQESVDVAMNVGASDYLIKPLPDLALLMTRIRSVAHRRLDGSAHDSELKALSRAIRQRTGDYDAAGALRKKFDEAKQDLNGRTEVALLIEEAGEARAFAEHLRGARLRLEQMNSFNEVVSRISDCDHPLVVVLDVDTQDVADKIRTLHRLDPMLEVLATSRKTTEDTLEAITSGASEFFVRSEEPWRALTARVKRCVGRGRRTRLFHQMLDVLERKASELGVTDSQAPSAPQRPATPLEPDVFGLADPTGGERRDSGRQRVDLRVTLWPVTEADEPTETRVVDLSTRGMFLTLAQPPELGTTVHVEFFAGRDSVLAEGTVVRSVRFEPDPARKSGVGVLFELGAARLIQPILDGPSPL